MAILTSEANSSNAKLGFDSSPCKAKSEPAQGSQTSPLHPCLNHATLIYVRYLDHVFYNRSFAAAMKPQTREAIGWLIYDCELYLTLTWDRDADPPTLHGGDPKASGLVLLKSDIITLERLSVTGRVSHGTVERVLNSAEPLVKDEYAFRPSERKTQFKGDCK